jgi:predicted PP-loop superfamily ATPase
MKVLVRTREGVEEVREVDSDWVIPGDVLSDGSIVLELWDELSDDDYLAMGLYD